VRKGLAGGFIAGAFVLLIQILSAWISVGEPLMPLKMTASIWYQIHPEFISNTVAIFAGGITLFAYTMIVGMVVALVVARTPAIYETRARIITFATLVGFALWIVNFYFITPLLNLPWFTAETNAFLQFLWHTFFFGTILGYYLDVSPPKEENG
jgi:hypothetical protein